MDEFLDYYSFDGDGHLLCLDLSNPSDLFEDTDREPQESNRGFAHKEDS